MDVDDAIRTRRTHKAYGSEPVPRETLEELFELARWAPNHNLTNPWRFRVLGPDSLARLKQAAGEEAAAKLDRAPTLVVASVVETGDPVQDEEDYAAAAVAAYIVLLGAHARGLAGYWRTPAVLRTPGGCSAAGVPDGERAIGLLHLGPRRQEKEPPERMPPGGCSAAGVPDGERAIGLLHLGPARQEKEPPERLPPGDFVTYLP